MGVAGVELSSLRHHHRLSALLCSHFNGEAKIRPVGGKPRGWCRLWACAKADQVFSFEERLGLRAPPNDPTLDFGDCWVKVPAPRPVRLLIDNRTGGARGGGGGLLACAALVVSPRLAPVEAERYGRPHWSTREVALPFFSSSGRWSRVSLRRGVCAPLCRLIGVSETWSPYSLNEAKGRARAAFLRLRGRTFSI